VKLMTIIEEHKIAVQDLDNGAFLPYGEVIKARSGMQNQFASNPYDPETSTEEAQLVLCNGQPRLWIMHLYNRGFAFTKLARHKKVSQCLGALQGKEWFIGVAPPQGEDERPSLKDVAVFRVPGDCVIKLHVSTWHAGPHFAHDEALFFNLENMNTNKKDFESIELATKCLMLA
jgi:ureidoglycolate hydrolase